MRAGLLRPLWAGIPAWPAPRAYDPPRLDLKVLSAEAFVTMERSQGLDETLTLSAEPRPGKIDGAIRALLWDATNAAGKLECVAHPVIE